MAQKVRKPGGDKLKNVGKQPAANAEQQAALQAGFVPRKNKSKQIKMRVRLAAASERTQGDEAGLAECGQPAQKPALEGVAVVEETWRAGIAGHG